MWPLVVGLFVIAAFVLITTAITVIAPYVAALIILVVLYALLDKEKPP